jgi:hypothetical protein
MSSFYFQILNLKNTCAIFLTAAGSGTTIATKKAFKESP